MAFYPTLVSGSPLMQVLLFGLISAMLGQSTTVASTDPYCMWHSSYKFLYYNWIAWSQQQESSFTLLASDNHLGATLWL